MPAEHDDAGEPHLRQVVRAALDVEQPRLGKVRNVLGDQLVARAGCAWRYLPADFPPWQTVYGYFTAWRDDGTLARLHDGLRARVRAAAGRDAGPTADGIARR